MRCPNLNVVISINQWWQGGNIDLQDLEQADNKWSLININIYSVVSQYSKIKILIYSFPSHKKGSMRIGGELGMSSLIFRWWQWSNVSCGRTCIVTGLHFIAAAIYYNAVLTKYASNYVNNSDKSFRASPRQVDHDQANSSVKTFETPGIQLAPRPLNFVYQIQQEREL